MAEIMFPLSNDVVFEFVMRDLELAKRVVEVALDIKVDHDERHETQDVLSSSAYGKRIRLDVYLEADDSCFDVEMQTARSKDLGLRLRAYQSLIDSSILANGDEFGKLKRSYIIFFCDFDPFSEELPLYTFEPMCAESRRPKLPTKQSWMLFNAKAWMREPRGDISSLLELIAEGNCGASGGTELTYELEMAVARANAKKDVRENAMISMEKKRELEVLYECEERFDEGKAEGEAIGEAKMAYLASRMLDADRSEELAEAAKDIELRKRLMAEYRIR